MNFKTSTVVALLILFCAATIAVAQNPFVGTWTLNQAKSHLTGDKIEFDRAEGGAIQLNARGVQYSFRVDGKDYRMASGDLAVWNQIDPATWQTKYLRPSGKMLNTDTWKLSSDGRTLTVVTSGTKPDGQKYSETAVYARTAGANGLLGSWRSTSVRLSSPDQMIIGDYGLGGLSVKIPAQKTSFVAAFDGKDVVPTGPTIPPGLTLAIVRIGPASFRLIEKNNGKVAYSARYAVSADGSSMTETGNAPGDPPQTAVWEKH